MELKVNIEYEQLLRLIKQLPASQIAKLKMELNKESTSAKSSRNMEELREIALNFPVMTKEEEKTFKETRKRFKEWRKKLPS